MSVCIYCQQEDGHLSASCPSAQSERLVELQKQLNAERAKVAELNKEVRKFLDIANENATQRNEAWALVAKLEQSESNAWVARLEMLKDRNALLDQTRTGPLSAEEWQIRAIRAERQLSETFDCTADILTKHDAEVRRKALLDAKEIALDEYIDGSKEDWGVCAKQIADFIQQEVDKQ